MTRVTFFIEAPGDTGKTFLINLLLSKVHKNIDHAVVSGEIAATLLDGKRTAQSMFCLPLDLTRQENRVTLKKFTKIKALSNL